MVASRKPPCRMPAPMRKVRLYLGGWVVAAMALSPGTSWPAGLPHHSGPASVCADCHALAEPGGGWTEGNPRLKNADVNLLCLSCHDGVRGVPDVMGADVNELRERSAGRFEPAGAGNPRGHDLDLDHTCIDCHDPHGNGMPRNLRLRSDPESPEPLGLFIRDGMTGLARYERENVAYGTLDSPSLREVSVMCLDCHQSLGGTKTGELGEHGGFLLHPSYDSRENAFNRIDQGAAGSSTDPSYWDQGTGIEFARLGRVPFLALGASGFKDAAAVDAGRNGVFCLSCHQAHGSRNAFALRWSSTGADGAAGCNECHAQGRRHAPVQLTEAGPTLR
jgi:predicted CXXCH cytochrome family protein